MPRFSKLLVFFIVLSSLAGCAVAPLNSTTTARSMGKDAQQAKINVAVPGLMYERGLSENFDIGAGVEIQSVLLLNVFGKYAFINKPEGGFSLAGLGGVGAGSGSKSIYAGPVVSYRHKWFESFLVARYNYVDWKNNFSSDDEADLLSFFPRKAHFSYSQLDVGMSYLGEKNSLSLGVKFFALEKDNSSLTPFVDIGFKF